MWSWKVNHHDLLQKVSSEDCFKTQLTWHHRVMGQGESRMRINLFYDYSINIGTSRTWGSCKWKITLWCKCWKYIFFYVRYMPKTLVELNLLRLILVILQVYSTDLKKLTSLENLLITSDSSLKDTLFLRASEFTWRGVRHNFNR